MDTSNFESILRALRKLSVDERTSVLQKVRRAKEPGLGRFLLEELPNVPDSPVTIFDFASALIEVAAVTPRDRAPGRGGVIPPDPRAETTAAIELLARKVERFHSVMNEQEWGGILMKVERLREVDATVFEDEAGKKSLDGIRRCLDRELIKAVDLSQGYLAGVNGFRLAREIADESTHETLLKLLTGWDIARKRFPDSQDRPDLVALVLAFKSLLRPACPGHCRETAQQLRARFAGEPTAEGHIRLEKLIRESAADSTVPEDVRGLMSEIVGELPK